MKKCTSYVPTGRWPRATKCVGAQALDVRAYSSQEAGRQSQNRSSRKLQPQRWSVPNTCFAVVTTIRVPNRFRWFRQREGSFDHKSHDYENATYQFGSDEFLRISLPKRPAVGKVRHRCPESDVIPGSRIMRCENESGVELSVASPRRRRP